MPVNRRAHARRTAIAAIAASLALAITETNAIGAPISAPVDTPALADLGNCDEMAPTAFQGGSETDVVGTTRGVVSRVYVKYPDLCNHPELSNSGSGAWVMLHVTWSGDIWYQVGMAKRPGDSCPHYFMQYNPAAEAPPITDWAGICPASATWYRFDLKKWNSQPSNHWDARVIRDSTNEVVWNAGPDPISLDFVPENAEYGSEVQNGGHDQSGGGVISRLTFDQARWYTDAGTIVWANMQGSERLCLMCGGGGPYNTQWYDGNTFEVWTDGFD